MTATRERTGSSGTLPLPVRSGKPVTIQVTTPSDCASQSQPQPDTATGPDLPVPDPGRHGQTESPGMACKRSGVRIPIAPPQFRDIIRNPEPQGSGAWYSSKVPQR